MKKYSVKITKKQSEQIKRLWLSYFRPIEDEYWQGVKEFEELLAKTTGIKDIEVVIIDGSVIGIGNTSRTMALIQRDNLD